MFSYCSKNKAGGIVASGNGKADQFAFETEPQKKPQQKSVLYTIAVLQWALGALPLVLPIVVFAVCHCWSQCCTVINSAREVKFPRLKMQHACLDRPRILLCITFSVISL